MKMAEPPLNRPHTLKMFFPEQLKMPVMMGSISTADRRVHINRQTCLRDMACRR